MSITATTLSNAVTTVARSLVVASATGFSAGKIVAIDDEYMVVTSVVSTNIGVARGRVGTAAKAHVAGAIVLVGSPIDFTVAPGSLLGTAAAGVIANEIVNGRHHITQLSFSALAVGAATGAAALSFGKLLYTLPDGAIQIRGSRMSIALQGGGTVDDDTPDGGLGTTVGSGVVSVLGGTAAFENILTGQTFNNCKGTAETKSIATNLVIETGGNKTIYFNLADTWAGADDVAGTGNVQIEWVRLF